MKAKAHKKAELFNPEKSKDVHHIFPRYFSKKYNLPPSLVNTEDNAIALERDFHSWIHGLRLNKEQLIDIIGGDLSELEKSLNDCEIEWKGFDEDDYIFLAVAYLGIALEYFDRQTYQKPRKPKKKRRR